MTIILGHTYTLRYNFINEEFVKKIYRIFEIKS